MEPTLDEGRPAKRARVLNIAGLYTLISIIEPYLSTKDLINLSLVDQQCHHYTVHLLEIRKLRKRREIICVINIALELVYNNPGQLVLAGGAALWLHEKQPTTWFPSDVDLFTYGMSRHGHNDYSETELDERYLSIEDNRHASVSKQINKYSNQLQDGSFVTNIILGCYTIHIQIVHLLNKSSIQAILATFELSCCRVGVTFTDHTLTYVTDVLTFRTIDAIRYVDEWCTCCDYTTTHTAWGCLGQCNPRMHKYIKRGITFSNQTEHKTERNRAFELTYIFNPVNLDFKKPMLYSLNPTHKMIGSIPKYITLIE
jgi:hypothetical protein